MLKALWYAIVAMTLIAGCVAARPPASDTPGQSGARAEPGPAAAAPPPPAPTPAKPPAAAPAAPVPSEGALPSPPPASAVPGPRPPAPVLSPQVSEEERLTKEVNARLGRAEHVIAQIDPAGLDEDHRQMFASIQDYVSKAREAISNKDLPRAGVLSEKASTLADELAATTR